MTDAFSGQRIPAEGTVVSNNSGQTGIHQLGYRSWSGVREPDWTRWIVIATIGVRRAWQNTWLKRMLFFAWLPAIPFGIGFFLWEQVPLYPRARQFLINVVINFVPSSPPGSVPDQIKSAIRHGDIESHRHMFWASLLYVFFRYPQAVLMLLIVGLIAPPLISQDIRSRAFLLYFSRPLTRIEYVVGKMASLWAYLAMISTVPAISLYVIGVVLSPNLQVLYATWDLPLRIILASLALMLPTSALALCLSSLTQESRYAGFAWFALWILGWFTYGVGTLVETFNAQQNYMQNGTVEVHESMWTHLSLYHTLGRVQSWIFGVSDLQDALVSIAILITVTTIALTVLFRKISAPMRV